MNALDIFLLLFTIIFGAMLLKFAIEMKKYAEEGLKDSEGQ